MPTAPAGTSPSSDRPTPAADAVRVGRATARLSRLLDQATSAAGLSLAQYRVLAFVATRPERASVLAAKADVRRATLSAIVGGLERAGLLHRARVDGDGRGVQLALTPAGQRLLREVEGFLAGQLAGAAQASALDLGALAGQLERLIGGFEQVAAVSPPLSSGPSPTR